MERGTGSDCDRQQLTHSTAESSLEWDWQQTLSEPRDQVNDYGLSSDAAEIETAVNEIPGSDREQAARSEFALWNPVSDSFEFHNSPLGVGKLRHQGTDRDVAKEIRRTLLNLIWKNSRKLR